VGDRQSAKVVGVVGSSAAELADGALLLPPTTLRVLVDEGGITVMYSVQQCQHGASQ
jgi:hypothetical protein